MHHLQEKFQITVPGKENGDEPWADADAQRDLRGLDPWVSKSPTDVDSRKFNFMPPGMELHNQWRTQQEQMPLTMMGENDVSKDTNPEAYREGFTRRKMKGTDDQYTGEHADHFYGDAGGFAERNNYLDRE